MKKRSVQILALIGVCLVLIAATVAATMQGKVVILDPSGQVAEQQKDLFVFATVLSVLVITPVFTMLFMFMITYRESNKKARYEPNWAHNKYIEATWLAIPSPS